MPKPACLTFRVPMRDPADTAAVAALFDDGLVRPDEVVAILGKTEGNGCVNDFTRGYATMALRAMLAARLGVAPAAMAHVPMVMSGGTEGGLSPHFLVFAVRRDGTGKDQGAATGTVRTEPQVRVRPEWALLDSNQRPSPCKGDALAN